MDLEDIVIIDYVLCKGILRTARILRPKIEVGFKI